MAFSLGKMSMDSNGFIYRLTLSSLCVRRRQAYECNYITYVLCDDRETLIIIKGSNKNIWTPLISIFARLHVETCALRIHAYFDTTQREYKSNTITL